MMRRAILAALLLAGPIPVAAAAPQPAAQAIEPFTARTVAPGVHLLTMPEAYRGPVVGNVTVVEQSDGYVLVDSGLTAADGRRIVAFVRSLSSKPVKAVLVTHWHNDHPQGVSSIREAWPGLRIIATEGTRRNLEGPAMEEVGFAPNEPFETLLLNQASGAIAQAQVAMLNPDTDEATRQRYRRMIDDFRRLMTDVRGTHLVRPTETFSDELLLDDQLRPIRLIHPGRANTDGDAVAWLPNERILVTGDIVVWPIPFGFYSFPGDWIGVLERLKAMDYRLLIPGHGEPQTDTAYLDRLIAAIGDIRAQVGPLARQGLGLDEIRERVDYSAQTAIFGDSPRHRQQFEGYWLRPMTVNAWIEARGAPMVQGDEQLYR